MDYQLELIGCDGYVLASQSFTAKDESEAAEIVLSLHSACSDAYEWCELWRGDVCIATSSRRLVEHWSLAISRLRRDRQERLLALEEALDASHAAMRYSDTLLDVNLFLRARLNA